MIVVVVIFVVVLGVVVVVMVLLMSLIITITAISKNVTEEHDGSHKFVISSRPSTPQLPQHIPPNGGLACNKTPSCVTRQTDSCRITAACDATVVCSNIVAILKPSNKCS